MLKMEYFLMLRDLYDSENNTKIHHNPTTLPIRHKRSNQPSKLDDYKDYINERIKNYPISAARIHREIREQVFNGGYTIVKDYIRQIRPEKNILAVLKFETNFGVQT